MDKTYIVAKKATKTGAEIYVLQDSWGKLSYVLDPARAVRLPMWRATQLAERINGYTLA